MTDALKFEVKKDRWLQNQEGSYKLTLTLNPTDLDDNGQELLMDFIKAPMGTIYMLGLAEVEKQAPQKPADADKPEKVSKYFHDYSRSQQAGMACKDADFQDWIGVLFPNTTFASNAADAILKDRLSIKSKTELDEENIGQHGDWDALYARYLSDTGRSTEQR